MPRRSKKDKTAAVETAPEVEVEVTPRVTKGDDLDVPPRPQRKQGGAPARSAGRGPRAKTLTAAQAGARVSGDGSPFAAFVQTRGLDPAARRNPEFYVELLKEFAARSIHGHRRRNGGNHKRNR